MSKVSKRSDRIKNFKEPAVSTGKSKPIEHTIIDENGNEITLKYSHGNNLQMFANEELNNHAARDPRNNYSEPDPQTYDKIVAAYKEGRSNTKFKSIKYFQTVYPRSENSFLKKARQRNDFSSSLWRAARSDRTKTSVTSSQGFTITSASTWPLDARKDFILTSGSYRALYKSSDYNLSGAHDDAAGELQNPYSLFGFSNRAALLWPAYTCSLKASPIPTAQPPNTVLPENTAGSGSGYYVDVPVNSTSSVFVSSSFSAFMWARHFNKSATPINSTQQCLFSIFTSGSSNTSEPTNAANGVSTLCSLHIDTDGTLFMSGVMEAGHGTGRQLTILGRGSGSAIVNDGKWHHVGFSYLSGTTAGNTGSFDLRTFVDGQLDARIWSATGDHGFQTNDRTGGNAKATGDSIYCWIGSAATGSAEAENPFVTSASYAGHIDEVTIWSGSLDDASVLKLYNNGRPLNPKYLEEFGHMHGTRSHGKSTAATNATTVGVKHWYRMASSDKVSDMVGAAHATASVYFTEDDVSYSMELKGASQIYAAPTYARLVEEKLDTSGSDEQRGNIAFAGQTFWDAPAHSGKVPYNDSYDDWSYDTKLLNKETTIMPEFRISDHMDFYINEAGGQFLTERPNFLAIDGASGITSSINEGFFNTYSHSERLNSLKKIKEDHEELGAPTEFVLRCNAVKKLLPYDGFYPANRTVQLAQLFSQSYGDRVTLKGKEPNFRTFLAPFFSPGILYNSIKSGISVDYPIMTSTWKTATRRGLLDGVAPWSTKAAAFSGSTHLLKATFPRQGPVVDGAPTDDIAGTALDLDTTFTISAWVMINQTPGNAYPRIIVLGSHDIYLYMYTDTRQIAIERDWATAGGGYGRWKTVKAALPEDNVWYHVAVTYDASAAANVPTFYVDGKALSTRAIRQPSSGAKEAIAGTLTVGNRSSGNRVWPGPVDEVSLYNSVLSAAQIATLYDVGAPRDIRQDDDGDSLDSYSDCVAWWRMGDGSGSLILGDDDGTTFHADMHTTGAAGMRVIHDMVNVFAGTNTRLFNLTASGWNADTLGPVSTADWYHLTGGAPDIYGRRIGSRFTQRLPFDSLVDPENYIKNVNLYDQEPHSSASLSSTASWDGTGQTLYKLAMHNFLAESIDFFLKDGKMTTLASSPESKWKAAKKGYHYSMDVALQKLGDFDMYDRPSAFGPLCNDIDSGSSYDPFTPPYTDGIAYARLQFYATEDITYTLDDILGGLTSSYFRNTGTLPPGPADEDDGTYANNWPAGTLGSATSPAFPGTTDKMHVSGVLNLLGRTRIQSVTYAEDGTVQSVHDDPNAPLNVWTIQPRWETPILNFSAKSLATRGLSITTPPTGAGTGSISRGMWHQYGAGSVSSEGVFMQIKESADYYTGELKTRPTASLAELVGFSTKAKQVGLPRDSKELREAVVAIPYFIWNNEKRFFTTGRLAWDMARRLALGQAPSSVLSDEPRRNPGESMIQMADAMTRYVFPPEYDILTNTSLSPFAMYIFEFSTKLSSKDLTDIWQNLMPDAARKAEKETVEIRHKFGMPGEPRELIHRALLDALIKNEHDIRWMVFKVKAKAQTNYFAKTADSKDDARFKFNFEIGDTGAEAESVPDYSYNWPYDYCSLVEVGNIEVGITIEAEDEE